MGYCTSCGHALGVGRFCTNCGHPVDAPAPPETSGARYPLFADEVEPELEAEPVALAPDPTQHRAPRAWWPWVAVLVALVLVAALVIVALDWANGDGERPTDASEDSSAPAGSGKPGGGKGGEVAGDATVTVPETAPPNQDTSGNRTTYAGANMLDGDPTTCWRMPGDGTGSEITATLADETHLVRVGMVNGYAKTAEEGDLDWYAGNRRVLTVEWVFDDGTTVEQELTDTRDLQTVDVDVTTTTVVVRLVSVSEPGTGPAARDYTAISELSLVSGR